MSKKKGGFAELLFTSIMPKVYGIGAAVVIVGAMFKILHLPGAAEMLGIGLSTEAVIFFLSAFEPKHEEID
ncbi:MAG: gliding motility protein GldL, partial [Cyclobacteriaceae bacterium]|nr:gliding motility protein GldL [Cyclobacteriaceae bacterium]